MLSKDGAYIGKAVVVAWVGACVLSVLDGCSEDGVVSFSTCPDAGRTAPDVEKGRKVGM